jgi:hypothetical protein
MSIRRVTPMLLVRDIHAAVARYELQGFKALPTEERECVGLIAEATKTGMMVLGENYATRTIPTAAVDELRKGAGLYVWVDALAGIASAGTVLGEVETSYGTRERYVREDGGLVGYAEQLG